MDSFAIEDKKASILIVDDNPANLDMIAAMLTDRGYDVRGVLSASMALMVASAEAPDLFLLDVMMPEMNGYELCKRLKADVQTQDIPVIFLSALDETLDKVHAFQVGGVDYLTKPIQYEELILRVEAHLALARLQHQEKQFAVMQERQRIARELHDAVSQLLFSASLLTEKLLTQPDQERADTRETLARLHEMLKAAMAEMRTLLLELHPETLGQMNLAELMQTLADVLSGHSTLRAELSLHGAFSLPAQVQFMFYRVAQEALNNVVKHAEASQVSLELIGAPDSALLRITDNGQGFDPTLSKKPGHFGLVNMQERAAAIAATLEIASIPQQGTTITLIWEQNHHG